MNNDLFDRLLVDLLRMPLEHRSETNVAEAIAELKAASDCIIPPLDELHQEHIKLAFIVEYIALHLDIQHYSVSLHLYDSNQGERLPLQVLIRDGKTGAYLVGLGCTAEQALRDLHAIPRHSGAQ